MSDSDNDLRGVESARPSDRRARVRHQACFPAEIDRGDGPIICIIRDLSTSGALLLTRARLKVGDAVKISLYILDDSNPRVVKGTIMRWERRSVGEGDVWPNKVGVQFETELTDCEDEMMAVADAQAQAPMSVRRPPPSSGGT